MPSFNQTCVTPTRLLVRVALALALLVVLSVPASSLAQHHGGGGPGGGGPGGFGGGGMAGDRMGGGFPRSARPEGDLNRNNPVRMHGSLQLGPPGRWWDDRHYAKQLKLTDDQKRHMDAIFEQSRPVLMKRLESLEQEEQRMDALTHAKAIDESALFAQIDRIEQARADLGKATMHYLVQIRGELDPDQISHLEAEP
jgi:Spy/CpxP family protein refolding chaperone